MKLCVGALIRQPYLCLGIFLRCCNHREAALDLVLDALLNNPWDGLAIGSVNKLPACSKAVQIGIFLGQIVDLGLTLRPDAVSNGSQFVGTVRLEDARMIKALPGYALRGGGLLTEPPFSFGPRSMSGHRNWIARKPPHGWLRRIAVPANPLMQFVSSVPPTNTICRRPVP